MTMILGPVRILNLLDIIKDARITIEHYEEDFAMDGMHFPC